MVYQATCGMVSKRWAGSDSADNGRNSSDTFERLYSGNRESEYVCIICTLKRISRYRLPCSATCLAHCVFWSAHQSLTYLQEQNMHCPNTHCTTWLFSATRENCGPNCWAVPDLRCSLHACSQAHHVRLMLHRHAVHCDSGSCQLFSVTGRGHHLWPAHWYHRWSGRRCETWHCVSLSVCCSALTGRHELLRVDKHRSMVRVQAQQPEADLDKATVGSYNSTLHRTFVTRDAPIVSGASSKVGDSFALSTACKDAW